jgi:predicted  nucleic acid-binding Zn-ribbon protein
MIKVLTILLIFFLAGCDVDEKKIRNLEDENALLQDEVFKLKIEINKQQNEEYQNYVSKKAEIDSLETAAAIYQTCNYLIPICPPSMTEKGKEAIKNGYGGGIETFWYWLILKLAALGALLGTFAAFFHFLSLRWVKPEEQQISKAHKLIETAENQVKSLQYQADKIKEVIRGLEQDQKAARLKLDEIFEAIDNKKVELKELETEIKQKQEQIQTIKDAKAAFDGIG